MNAFYALIPPGMSPILLLIGIFGAICLYIYLYYRNPKLALVLLAGIILVIVYMTADWNYWQRHFMIEWRLPGGG